MSTKNNVRLKDYVSQFADVNDREAYKDFVLSQIEVFIKGGTPITEDVYEEILLKCFDALSIHR